MEPTSNGHALILDMDPERSSAVAEIVKEQGYVITQMQGVGAALGVCARVPFAIILLGEVPPGHDRPAVCRALRQMSNSAILAISYNVEDSAVMPLLDAGASDIVPYPIERQRLRLRVVVAQRRAAAQSHAEAMLRALPDLVFRVSGSAEFLAFHAASSGELVAPADQIVGRKLEEVLPFEVARLAREALRRALDTGDLQVIRYRLDVPRGEQDYEARLVPSGPDEVLTIVRNITARTQVETLGRANVSLAAEVVERRRAEEALRASEAQWRSLVENCPDFVVTIDSNGKILFTNRPLAPDGRAGVGMTIFALAPESATAPLRAAVEQVFSRGEPAALEIVVEPDKHQAFDVRMAPIASDGKVKSAVILARDITERRAAEAERARMQERLLTAQKLDSLGLLAGGVAHDFNNLLTAILGSASIALLKLPADGPARRAIETLVTAARRASDLTQQLLAYSGRGKFEVRPIDLSEHVRELLLVMEAAVPKRIALRLRLDPNLPAVSADVAQMQQLLMNLVINAAEAIGERAGTIALTTGRQDVDEAYIAELHSGASLKPGPHAYLEVSDDGCGMDPDMLAKVVDPFFSTKATGRGLGLAAALGIVRSHQGGLRIESSPGQGSKFRVLLPVSPAAPAPRAEEVPSPEQGGVVLVVDDERLLRRAARQIIEHFGYEALEAEDGRAALAIFRERAKDISIVLLDMTMPGMSGEETFHELRRIRPDVCVVLSSGYNELEATKRFAGGSFAAFLQKPYTAEQLANCLASVRANPTKA